MTTEAVNNSTDEAIKEVGAGKTEETKVESTETKATETKAVETPKAETKTETKVEEKKVPEKYELNIPKDSKLTAQDVDEIATFSKERGLSNEQAQAVVERESKLREAFEKNAETQLAEATTKWAESAKSDKEIGGEEFPRNAELAKRVVERFATPEFKQALNKTGFGNHPELIRIFTRIGKAMSNDQLVMPGSQTNQKVDVASKFYGDSSKKE